MDHILNLKKNTAVARLESLAGTIAYKNGFPCELYDNKYSNANTGGTYTSQLLTTYG